MIFYFLYTDISQSRLDFAKQLGADHAILADTRDGLEMSKRVKSAFGDHMPEVTIECSGAESATQLAIYVSENLVIRRSHNIEEIVFESDSIA